MSDRMELHPTTTHKITVPAGTYVLGDPCYSVPRDRWSSLLKSCDFFEKPVGDVDGVQVLAFSTRCGDGEYKGPNGIMLLVDSGLLGLVPVGMPGRRADELNLTTQITFDSPTLCECRENGTLIFGKHRVKT